MTKVDAAFLTAWQRKAHDPDHIVCSWMSTGSPAGINHELEDPGIFPVCTTPAEMLPYDLRCDARNFRNYQGVEENEITETELSSHIEAEHLAVFDAMEEFTNFVGA